MVLGLGISFKGSFKSCYVGFEEGLHPEGYVRLGFRAG